MDMREMAFWQRSRSNQPEWGGGVSNYKLYLGNRCSADRCRVRVGPATQHAVCRWIVMPNHRALSELVRSWVFILQEIENQLGGSLKRGVVQAPSYT